LDGLIERNQQAIAVLRGDLVTINKIGVALLAGTRQTMLALPELVKRVPQALIDGQLHNGLVIQDEPLSCVYDTEERLPYERTAIPPDTTQQCDPVEGGKRTTCWAEPTQGMERCVAGQTDSADVAPLATGTGNFTLTADGSLATVGWEGGQQEVLGDHAWPGLLLAALQ
jgi:hypothetical protein